MKSDSNMIELLVIGAVFLIYFLLSRLKEDKRSNELKQLAGKLGFSFHDGEYTKDELRGFSLCDDQYTAQARNEMTGRLMGRHIEVFDFEHWAGPHSSTRWWETIVLFPEIISDSSACKIERDSMILEVDTQGNIIVYQPRTLISAAHREAYIRRAIELVKAEIG
ncbi:MAG: hypothetical protein MI802_21135 [Desulfobacterales bacterium]|nr:hypothetical protein [Desulfobacterales bacterium]